MNIARLELLAADLQAQREFYANVLELPAKLTSSTLEVKARKTEILFTRASLNFYGAYHFAFNIPENQFPAAKAWISSRVPLMRDENGKDEFNFEAWNAHSLYFKDPAGNILEFIARHNLQHAMSGDFNSQHILQVSEIGLPSEDAVGFANELCTRLGLSVFLQQPNEMFTPVGDD